MKPTTGSSNRWAIVLAGGEGCRLSELTRRISGINTPKQFCGVFGRQSLLEQTRKRNELIVPKDRIFYALTRSHEHFFAPLLSDVLFDRLVIQPLNRGTAPAVLYSLMRLGLVDPDARVALFPSDQYVSDDHVLMCHVRAAFEVLSDHPEVLVVLGTAPPVPEPDSSWIVPASPFIAASRMLFNVHRFLVKPPLEVAQKLWAQGRCLWNSSVIVARLPNLLALLIRTLPDLYDEFEQLAGAMRTQFEIEAAENIYQSIRSADLGAGVTAANACEHFSVLPVSGLYWNDLDNSRQVFGTLARIGARPDWSL